MFILGFSCKPYNLFIRINCRLNAERNNIISIAGLGSIQGIPLTNPYFIGYFVKCKMRREFIETPSFTKRWFALGFNDDDLAELQQFFIKNPEAGDVMIGTARNWRKEHE